MNWLDVFIILFLLASLIRGTEVGFIRQFCSTFGFFSGLFLGAWLESKAIHLVNTPGKRALLALVMTLGLAFGAMALGDYLGWRLKFKLQQARIIDRFDRVLGSVLAGITLLLAVWLGAAIFRGLPDGMWQRQIRGSRIVSMLNSTLPSAPGVLTGIGHLIDPNGPPQVFAGLEPAPKDAPLPDLGDLNDAVKNGRPSVVKIEGKGCGGIVEGSGFVAADEEVLTNAHVVAGVSKPFVLDSNGEHSATVVYFDPDLDVAVLRVSNLTGKPLLLNAQTPSNGTAVAMMGYPNNKGITPTAGVILDSFTAIGRNIYNQGQTERQVFSVKTDVKEGNSGGPLLSKDGSVVGVIFAKSTSYDQVGYALTIPQLTSSLAAAAHRTASVNTGSCAE